MTELAGQHGRTAVDRLGAQRLRCCGVDARAASSNLRTAATRVAFDRRMGTDVEA